MLAFVLIIFALANANRTCLQGWTKEKESCYKLLVDKLFWKDAEKYCEKMDSRLVTLNDQDEQNFVLALMRHVKMDTLWIGLLRNTTGWTWTDVNETSINHLIASNVSSENCCVALSDAGDWLQERCDVKKAFLCESTVTGCPTAIGWIEHDFRCLFLLSTKRDWASSRSKCNSIGADLAILNDLKADSFLQSQTTLRDWLWVGLQFNTNYHNYTWIDGRAGYVENVTTIAPHKNDACGAVNVDHTSRQLISMATSCATRLYAVCEKAWIEDISTTNQPENYSLTFETTLTLPVSVTNNELDLTPLTDLQKRMCEKMLECLQVVNTQKRFKCIDNLLSNDRCLFDLELVLKTIITLNSIDADTKISVFRYLVSTLSDHDLNHSIFCFKHQFEVLDRFERLIGIYLTSRDYTAFSFEFTGISISVFSINPPKSQGYIYEGTSAGCLIQNIFTIVPGDDLIISAILTDTLYEKVDFESWSWSYDYYIISTIMTLSVYQNSSKYSAGIIFTLLHTFDTDQEALKLFKRNTTSVKCAFYKPNKRKWSSDGCREIKTDAYITSCECNHTTSFAILMKVRNYEMTQAHKTALSVITSIGCSVSMIAMFISLTVFTCVRSLISERVFVHRNLCLAILSAQIIFLAGIKATYHRSVCRVIAIVLHYCYISMFTWMLVEGLHLYTKVVQVFGTEKSRISYYCFFGWGIPCILVAISSVANFDGYGTDDSCWLSIRRNTIWAFVGPAVAVIIVNIVILLMVLRILIKSVRLERPKCKDQIMAGVKGTFLLLPLLGLTWTFGLLAINESLVFFEYAFAVCNSLQGFFVFLFHCAMNTEVRQALQRLRERRSFLIRGEGRMSVNNGTSESEKLEEDKNPFRERRFRISGRIRVSPAPTDQAINNTEIELAAASLHLENMTRSTFH